MSIAQLTQCLYRVLLHFWAEIYVEMIQVPRGDTRFRVVKRDLFGGCSVGCDFMNAQSQLEVETGKGIAQADT